MWYAVQIDEMDTDWGYGFNDLVEAKKALCYYYDMGFTDARIAVIDGEECVQELHYEDI